METTKLTLKLRKEDVDFARRYAEAHHLSVSELIDRHLRALRLQDGPIHPEVARVSGVIPAVSTEDPRDEYHEHLFAKHR